MPELLPFVRDTRTAKKQTHTRELAFHAARQFARCYATLVEAQSYLEARMNHRSAWGVPELFYFDSYRAEELNRLPARPDDAHRRAVLDAPKSYTAWQQLPDLLDDTLTLVLSGVEMRRVLRATVGFTEAIEAWAGEHPKLQELCRIADVTDDDTICVIHPSRHVGYRVHVTGIESVRQLHVLLADVIVGSASRGFVPGSRPSSEVLEVASGRVLDTELKIDSIFQFLRPQALSHGCDIQGWDAVDFWLWGNESLKTLPRIGGERLVLITEPTIANTFDPSPVIKKMQAEVKLLEVMSSSGVEDLLHQFTGQRTTQVASYAA